MKYSVIMNGTMLQDCLLRGSFRENIRSKIVQTFVTKLFLFVGIFI